jgi:hypothetical protein
LSSPAAEVELRSEGSDFHDDNNDDMTFEVASQLQSMSLEAEPLSAEPLSAELPKKGRKGGAKDVWTFYEKRKGKGKGKGKKGKGKTKGDEEEMESICKFHL